MIADSPIYNDVREVAPCSCISLTREASRRALNYVEDIQYSEEQGTTDKNVTFPRENFCQSSSYMK
jgi:hypothetical protein